MPPPVCKSGSPASYEREALADEREQAADEREAQADERERQADEREREADRREAMIGQRQLEADEREHDLDERGRAAGTTPATLGQRTLETIERSRALLAISADCLDRQEAAVKQAEAPQAAASRDRQGLCGNRTGLAAWLPDPSHAVKHAEELREQALTAIEALARTEEEIARIHEELT
jgi:hypothetical protein